MVVSVARDHAKQISALTRDPELQFTDTFENKSQRLTYDQGFHWDVQFSDVCRVPLLPW